MVLRFGALVDFDGIRGVIPSDELDPAAPLQDGQQVAVEVADTDTRLGQVSLRLRA